jgi:hypothetical protein
VSPEIEYGMNKTNDHPGPQLVRWAVLGVFCDIMSAATHSLLLLQVYFASLTISKNHYSKSLVDAISVLHTAMATAEAGLQQRDAMQP